MMEYHLGIFFLFPQSGAFPVIISLFDFVSAVVPFGALRNFNPMSPFVSNGESLIYPTQWEEEILVPFGINLISHFVNILNLVT